MACFTKAQQRNGTNCEFEKYVTTIYFLALKSLDKSHLNSVCTWYVYDNSENARVCAKWQWNALNWCYWIALPASPVVQSSYTVSCVSLSFRIHPCVLAIDRPMLFPHNACTYISPGVVFVMREHWRSTRRNMFITIYAENMTQNESRASPCNYNINAHLHTETNTNQNCAIAIIHLEFIESRFQNKNSHF